MERDDVTKAHQITFNRLGSWERFKEFWPYLPREVPTFGSVAISCWAIAEILIAILGNRPDLSSLAAPVLGVSGISALLRAYRGYQKHLPEALLGEPQATREIYRAGEYGWQWALARVMLHERLHATDAELDRIRSGSEYIEPKHLSNRDYFRWLRARPEFVLRLIKSAKVLVTSDVPLAIGKTVSEDQLADMKVQIEALALLYRKTADFERDCHAVLAPELFRSLHEMQYGWTDTIRNGIREFCGIVDELSHMSKQTLQDAASGEKPLPVFNITFEAPANAEEFSTRLAKIDPARVNSGDW